MAVNENTELRKLLPAELYNIAMILSPSENWKKLVSVVTKEGIEGVPKFDGKTIAIIENASRHERKPEAAIFLEEWATLGRKRPTLGLLLKLLIKAELFRAADYLAVDILKVEAPARPVSGPAVPIDVEEALVELLGQQNLESCQDFEDTNLCLSEKSKINLRQINYPMDISHSETSDSDNNFAVGDNEVGIIEMQYNQTRSNQVLDHARRYTSSSDGCEEKNNLFDESKRSESLNVFKSNVQSLENDNDASKACNECEISDLMKFSGASNRSNHHGNLERLSGSDLIEFVSAKMDINENERNNAEICDNILPNFDTLCSKLLSRNKRESEMSEKFDENPDSDVSVTSTNNHDDAPICEMISSELPAVLKEFDASNYFHRELMSSELPLCINDRTGFNSSESNSSRENSSTASSLFSDSGTLESTEGSLKNEPTENSVPSSELPCFVVEAGMSQKNQCNDENFRGYQRSNYAFDSQVIPVTVLEFQQR